MYPAAFIPLETIASAISRTILSLTWLRNLFQLFQPMGGVLPRPLDFTAVLGAGSVTAAVRGGRAAGGSFDTRASSSTVGAGGAFLAAVPGAPPRPAGTGSVSFIFSPSIAAVYVMFCGVPPRPGRSHSIV